MNGVVLLGGPAHGATVHPRGKIYTVLWTPRDGDLDTADFHGKVDALDIGDTPKTCRPRLFRYIVRLREISPGQSVWVGTPYEDPAWARDAERSYPRVRYSMFLNGHCGPWADVKWRFP